MTDEFVLNLFTSAEGEEVILHADAAGLDMLIKELQAVRSAIDGDVCEHFHLLGEGWGGDDLTAQTLEKDGHVVQHLKVCGWTEEWAVKHKLKGQPD